VLQGRRRLERMGFLNWKVSDNELIGKQTFQKGVIKNSVGHFVTHFRSILYDVEI